MIVVSSGLKELAESLERGIQDRTHGRVRDLRVELDARSWVVLIGKAPDQYTKQLALDAALDLSADRGIVNRIEVG